MIYGFFPLLFNIYLAYGVFPFTRANDVRLANVRVVCIRTAFATSSGCSRLKSALFVKLPGPGIASLASVRLRANHHGEDQEQVVELQRMRTDLQFMLPSLSINESKYNGHQWPSLNHLNTHEYPLRQG